MSTPTGHMRGPDAAHPLLRVRHDGCDEEPGHGARKHGQSALCRDIRVTFGCSVVTRLDRRPSPAGGGWNLARALAIAPRLRLGGLAAREKDVSLINLALVVLAAVIFVGAAACAKLYVIEPAWWRLAGALALYTAGNLVVIRVLRDVGLGLAMSLSTVVQLIVVNLLAVAVFRERLTGSQFAGVALGVAAVVLMMLPARGQGEQPPARGLDSAAREPSSGPCIPPT